MAAMNVIKLAPDNVARRLQRASRSTLEGKARKAMADQIATVARRRLQTKIGRLTSSDMAEVERAIRVQLAL